MRISEGGSSSRLAKPIFAPARCSGELESRRTSIGKKCRAGPWAHTELSGTPGVPRPWARSRPVVVYHRMYNSKLHFHFTGIGGSGMSGLAEILLTSGFRVSGSDQALSSVCKRLQGLGATIFQGHDAQNLPAASSLLVYSSAVGAENPELVEARRRGIPVIRRAEVLAELMRLKFGVAVAGSHGKTTTTSMIAAVLERGGLDPTVVIGGQVRTQASGGRVGRGSYLVAETDESDRSFLLLRPTIAVVTNIDNEHLNAYSSLADLFSSFEQFVSSVPFYGLGVFCIDDSRVRDLAKQYPRRQVTYGLSPDAEYQLTDVSVSPAGTRYAVLRAGEPLMEVHLPTLGRHLALNSLAAVAVGIEFGLAPELIRDALSAFPGVKRRLEVISTVHGITVVSDYGHHPTEIRATLRALREAYGRSGKVHVIFQPHRYTRTRDCFVDFLAAFEQADRVAVTEIYAASEQPLPDVNGARLCAAMSHPAKQFFPELPEALGWILSEVQPGDTVVCLGAGSIGAFAEEVPQHLEALVQSGVARHG